MPQHLGRLGNTDDVCPGNFAGFIRLKVDGDPALRRRANLRQDGGQRRGKCVNDGNLLTAHQHCAALLEHEGERLQMVDPLIGGDGPEPCEDALRQAGALVPTTTHMSKELSRRNRTAKPGGTIIREDRALAHQRIDRLVDVGRRAAEVRADAVGGDRLSDLQQQGIDLTFEVIEPQGLEHLDGFI